MITAFPAIYSQLAPEMLVERVFPQYALEPVMACRFWHRGLSDVYLVETIATQYILRISHAQWRSKAEVDFELELLDFLKQRSLPVAFPLRTSGGQLSIELEALEGKRYAALFVYAPGTVALGDLNQTQSFLLGQTVAKLHQTALAFRSCADRPPLTLEYLLDQPLAAIAPFLRHKPAELAYLTQAIAAIKTQLQHFTPEPPLWSVCWGDPHSGNVHFTPDNQLTLFDFDQCGYGWRIFEIAKFLQVSMQSGLCAKVRQSFIDGYQTVEPLWECEQAALQAFIQVAHIWSWSICLNHAMRHNYSRLDDSYFQQRLEYLKRLRSPEWQLF